MKRLFSALGVALLTRAALAADPEIVPTLLTLHPAAASSPALKYALLPELRDTIPGNAVEHYRQAIKNMPRDAPTWGDWQPTVDRWMAVPLKDLPRDDVEEFLKRFESALQEAEAGARSEQCDWGLMEEMRKKGVRASTSDLAPMRQIGILLALRFRNELAEGRADKAVRTLQTGFAIAAHLAHAPPLVYCMLGFSIDAMMLGRVEELVQQPDAPNLYWPLTDLPQPLIDLRNGLQGDRVTTYGDFPGMADMAANLNAKPWTPEQGKKFMAEYKAYIDANGPLEKPEESDVEFARRLTARHEAAKKALIDQGRPKELVDAMPEMQVALLEAFLQYDEVLDECRKLESLSFWEADAPMEKVDARVKEMLAEDKAPVLPLAKSLPLVVRELLRARGRIDRRIAALRCIEAVRLYAAGHDGKLPTSLDDIKDVPLPTDPVTGKPFDYRLAGDRASLTSTPFPRQLPNKTNTPTYELMIQR